MTAVVCALFDHFLIDMFIELVLNDITNQLIDDFVGLGGGRRVVKTGKRDL